MVPNKKTQISYLTDHVLYMPSMCKGWSLTTSMMMGSLFCGKFHVQVLQKEEKNQKINISIKFYFTSLKNVCKFTMYTITTQFTPGKNNVPFPLPFYLSSSFSISTLDILQLPVTCSQTKKSNACDVSDLSALHSDLALDKSIHKVCFSLVSIFILFCKFKIPQNL